MSDMQDLVRQATSLGQAIAGHDRVKAFFAAQQAVHDNADAQTLLRDFQGHAEHLQKLEAEQKPIEVADKNKLSEFESRVATNALVMDLMRRQADYVELMDQINRAMAGPLGGGGQPQQ